MSTSRYRVAAIDSGRMKASFPCGKHAAVVPPLFWLEAAVELHAAVLAHVFHPQSVGEELHPLHEPGRVHQGRLQRQGASLFCTLKATLTESGSRKSEPLVKGMRATLEVVVGVKVFRELG